MGSFAKSIDGVTHVVGQALPDEVQPEKSFEIQELRMSRKLGTRCVCIPCFSVTSVVYLTGWLRQKEPDLRALPLESESEIVNVVDTLRRHTGQRPVRSPFRLAEQGLRRFRSLGSR